MEYALDKDDNKTTDVPYLMPDSSPLFELLYHFVPGKKSLSEIHGMQIKQWEVKNGGALPNLVNILSIPPPLRMQLNYFDFSNVPK